MGCVESGLCLVRNHVMQESAMRRERERVGRTSCRLLLVYCTAGDCELVAHCF